MYAAFERGDLGCNPYAVVSVHIVRATVEVVLLSGILDGTKHSAAGAGTHLYSFVVFGVLDALRAGFRIEVGYDCWHFHLVVSTYMIGSVSWYSSVVQLKSWSCSLGNYGLFCAEFWALHWKLPSPFSLALYAQPLVYHTHKSRKKLRSCPVGSPCIR